MKIEQDPSKWPGYVQGPDGKFFCQRCGAQPETGCLCGDPQNPSRLSHTIAPNPPKPPRPDVRCARPSDYEETHTSSD